VGVILPGAFHPRTLLTTAALAWLVFALGTVLLDSLRRTRALLGLGVSMLAVASLSAEGSPATGFLVINASLLLLGAGLGLAGTIPILRNWKSTALWGRAGALVLGLGALSLAGVARSITTLHQLALGALTGLVVSLAAVGGFQLVGVRLAARLQAPARSEPAVVETGADAPGSHPPPGLIAVGALGALLALVGPHLWLVLGGAVLSGVSLDLVDRRQGMGRFPLRSASLLAIGPFAWLLATIAAPTGLSLAALRSAPLSPAAEILLVPMLALPAWGLSGAWPFHQRVGASLLAPVGWALLARLGHQVMPEGVEHWGPVLFPLLAIGIWHGALTRSPMRVASGLGLLGVLSTGNRAMWAGGVLALVAAILALRHYLTRPLSRPRFLPSSVLLLLPAWAGLEGLRGALATQVVYSVIVWAGVLLSTVLIPREHRR
jgi:hypothetical protein